MNKPNAKKTSIGVAMAIAAAGMLSACESSNGEKAAAVSPGGNVDLVHCYGVNICGGHNDCKTANNACAGNASCKGTGFVAMPPKACADVGGNTQDSWTGSTAKTDLIHCNGVNKCGGHNDCKTANNACAGHASCKGTGFVAMTAKACGDIGGKVG